MTCRWMEITVTWGRMAAAWEIVDVLSGEKRRATRQDLMDVGRVADYLDGIAFHWVPLSAQDCPPETRSLHELNSIWSSRKHVQTEEIVTDREMAAAIEMAAVLRVARKHCGSAPAPSCSARSKRFAGMGAAWKPPWLLPGLACRWVL